MYDRVSINKVLNSKPIYSTCFTGLSVLSALKISTGVNTIEESAIDVSYLYISKQILRYLAFC